MDGLILARHAPPFCQVEDCPRDRCVFRHSDPDFVGFVVAAGRIRDEGFATRDLVEARSLLEKLWN